MKIFSEKLPFSVSKYSWVPFGLNCTNFSESVRTLTAEKKNCVLCFLKIKQSKANDAKFLCINDKITLTAFYKLFYIFKKFWTEFKLLNNKKKLSETIKSEKHNYNK